MKRYKTLLGLLLVAVLVLGVYQVALAANNQTQASPKPGRPVPSQIINDLNLTPEQVAKIKELRLAFEKDTLQLRTDIKSKEINLRELRQAASPDLNQINAAIDELFRLRAELAKKEAAQQLALQAVFTPEQRAKMETYRLFGFGHRPAMRAHHFRGEKPEKTQRKSQ